MAENVCCNCNIYSFPLNPDFYYNIHFCLQDSPSAAGCFSENFPSAAARSLRSVFRIIGISYDTKKRKHILLPAL